MKNLNQSIFFIFTARIAKWAEQVAWQGEGKLPYLEFNSKFFL
jgi:hypothetical protein